MLFFDKEKIASDRNIAAQFTGHTQAERRYAHHNQKLIVDQYGQVMDSEDLTKNAAENFGVKFWAEIDRAALEVRDNEGGRGMLDDLLGIATSVNIGKTVKTYAKAGDIHEEVKISMDGQTPITFDHVDRTDDADPIPIMNCGFGINWRHWQGLMTENIDLLAESQAAKMKVFRNYLAKYIKDGDKSISVAGYAGQGIRNHRNTQKIDLTLIGIDLTAAATTNDAIVNFWSQAFAIQLDANYLTGKIDIVWVSPEIMRRMSVPFSTSAGFKGGALIQYVIDFGRVKEFRVDYDLVGNEFIAYNRDRNVITPLVAQAMSTTPVPRLKPRDNYNFEIWAAMGLQIKADANGRSSVFYAKNFT